jgi:hypothetical protein
VFHCKKIIPLTTGAAVQPGTLWQRFVQKR